MPDSGTDLGADLYLLYRAGRETLPTLATVFADANRSVAGTHDGQETAFRRSPQFGGAYGPAYAAFTGLRDDLQRFLGETSTSLELTGEALCLAVQNYRAADTVAAQELDRLRQVNGEPDSVPVPVPQNP